MNISPLTDQNAPAALAYLRAWPYRNALLLANVAQLRARCDVLVAERGARILGLASTYHDLPMPNMVFAAERDDVAAALITALAARNPALHDAPIMALLPERRFRQLGRIAQIDTHQIEYQLGVEPETLRPPVAPAACRLTNDDLPAMTRLAAAVGLAVWHEGALEIGPAWGCFVGSELVAMAATHFTTPKIIEIGHVATHPNHRRQGYASACTAALTQAAFALAPRVFLMVLDDNHAARATYRQLGFHPIDRFYLTTFRLRTSVIR